MNAYRFSDIELRDLAKAWIAISVAFAIVLSGRDFGFASTFVLSLLTVGVGFILHEMGHKFMAQNYHLRAEFRSDDKMLVLAVLMSFVGFVFVAPGAVMIMGHVPAGKYGKIALAGPAMNIILAVLFLIVSPLLTGYPLLVAMYGMRINAWLALFNMIPFGNFDGIKIMRWSKSAYGGTLVAAALLVFVA